MVNTGGQLYTIEGIAAGLIMILTAFFVVNATSVYTAGDTHISDMQLEVLGSDALKMMDMNETYATLSPLRSIIRDTPPGVDNKLFGAVFRNLIDKRTDIGRDRIQFMANVTYYNTGTGMVESYPLNATRALTGGEHAVRATKWVIVDKRLPGSGTSRDRAVLVEVLMWRD